MIQYEQAISRKKAFLALSRTTHGVMDMATPALAALLCLGTWPSSWVISVGLVTAFAGYTAVYALNDVVDFKRDRQRIENGSEDSPDYLDTVFVRHPMARGIISYGKGLSWTAAWSVVALIGAYLLNPLCALIFLMGMALESVYCRMLQVSPFRVLVSGVVKTLGGLAAVFAVQPDIESPLFLAALFAWLFFWEVGGQNVPADWHDIEEDRALGFKTVPVLMGKKRASIVVLTSLVFALLFGIAVFLLAPGRLSPAACVAALFVGAYLLLMPAYRLYVSGSDKNVTELFNRASHYPLALFVVVMVDILVKGVMM
jgi:4-hydroxybenzoate polyprenyltransferase